MRSQETMMGVLKQHLAQILNIILKLGENIDIENKTTKNLTYDLNSSH